MKVVAIVQARMGSTRLPGKVLLPVRNVPIIELLLHRLSLSTTVNQIILATSHDDNNAPLVDHVSKLGFDVVYGDEDDVLDRYYQAARLYQADIVIRITGDCPLVDPRLVDAIVNQFIQEDELDYLSNTIVPTFPDGLDVEVFTFDALHRAWNDSKSEFEREHVTPYLRESSQFNIKNFSNNIDYSHMRWTLDEQDDFKVIKNVFDHFKPQIDFSWYDVISLVENSPNLFKENSSLMRNQGAELGRGQKLWKRAKKIIPGGNMLLSKRPEMFLPEQWPSYFSKSRGCEVWDLDGDQYTDMSIMGIGTNILGYRHPEVDKAVHSAVDAGNMSTFNCPEEVELAERLIELHPWADMARFARTGGEANAISIRIARAASAKDKVAICGYHGWHDWYLSANLIDNNNLTQHLLPDLDSNGVPSNLSGTVYPFQYNDIEMLEKIISEHDIGVIKMEVRRNHEPKDNFLHKVRDIATANNIVLIFDECTSGFRENFGGLHKTYNVEPDIAIFGKALGNGYAITAVLGRRDVMESAQSTFISSTFWTERIGPVAALKTLEVMEKERSWNTITETGLLITKLWEQLAEKHGLSIVTSGLPALTTFSFQSSNTLAYKTLITQEMLKKGYIAGNSVYVCIEHKRDVVNEFIEQLDPVFGLIRECEDGRDVMNLLDGPVCHSGFQRLN